MTSRVANRLRAELAERHWSQQDLADLSGLPYATVRRLLRSAVDPPLDLALAVCRALRLEVEDLYWLEPEGEDATRPGEARGGARNPGRKTETERE